MARRPIGLLARTTAAQACGAVILLVALRGLGVGDELGTVEFARVFFVVTLLSSFVPVPGGVGVVEAGLSGALVAAGVDPAVALAGVLVYRLLTYVVPIVVGAILYAVWRAEVRRRPVVGPPSITGRCAGAVVTLVSHHRPSPGRRFEGISMSFNTPPPPPPPERPATSASTLLRRTTASTPGGYPPAPGCYPGGWRTVGPKPPSYLVWAILTTLFCCLPFGIASIVFAAQVDSKYNPGDLAGSQQASDRARSSGRSSRRPSASVVFVRVLRRRTARCSLRRELTPVTVA